MPGEIENCITDGPQRTLVPRACGQEAHRHDGLRVGGEEDVPGDLFLGKSGKRFVRIEGVDDVIPVGPGIRPDPVLVVSMGLRVVNRVQPVSGPAFTVSGRGQQPIHDGLIGVRRCVGQEARHLLRGGWQADQVEKDAPQQGPLVRGRAWMERVLLKSGQNEQVDRGARPGLIFYPGQCGFS